MKDYYSSYVEEDVMALYSSLEDPASYEEAIKEEKWKSAMRAEIDAIESNQTWEFVNAVSGVKPIGVK